MDLELAAFLSRCGIQVYTSVSYGLCEDAYGVVRMYRNDHVCGKMKFRCGKDELFIENVYFEDCQFYFIIISLYDVFLTIPSHLKPQTIYLVPGPCRCTNCHLSSLYTTLGFELERLYSNEPTSVSEKHRDELTYRGDFDDVSKKTVNIIKDLISGFSS